MPKILVAFAVAVLLFAGCSSEDEDNPSSPSEMPAGVHWLSAPQDTVIELRYAWTIIDANHPCNWELRKTDTSAIRATFTANLTAPIDSFQLLGSLHGGEFELLGSRLAPSSGGLTVDIPIGYPGTLNDFYPDTILQRYYVEVTARDHSQWISPVISIRTTKTIYPPITTPPPAPDLDTLYEYYDESLFGGRSLNFRWCKPAPDVTGYRLYRHNSYDNGIEVDTVTLNPYSPYLSDYGHVTYYLPLTTYSVWMVAVSPNGDSPVSDTVSVVTGPPAVPINLRAVVTYPETTVSIWYQGSRSCDSLLLQRRALPGDWMTVSAVPGRYSWPGMFADTTAVPGSEYDYRVGIGFPNGTWWGRDSVHVRVG